MTAEEVVEETKADGNEPSDAGEEPDLGKGTCSTEWDSEQPGAEGVNIPFEDCSTRSNTRYGLRKKSTVPDRFK